MGVVCMHDPVTARSNSGRLIRVSSTIFGKEPDGMSFKRHLDSKVAEVIVKRRDIRGQGRDSA